MKYRTKLWLTGLTGGILSLAFLFLGLSGQEPIRELIRPGSGAGNREQALQVELAGEKYPLEVTLQEIPYEESDRDRRLQEASRNLETLFLKENPDLKHIVSGVSMPSVYPDSRITIQWYLDSWEYVEPDGRIKNVSLEGPVPVRVQAILALDSQELTWEREMIICPLSDPNEEQKLQMLQYQVQMSQEEPSGTVRLPDSILGEPVVWYPEADRRWLGIAGLTLLALCGMAAGKHSQEEKEEKERERNMQMAYPDIVSRLSLYMGAGISTRRAWERIVESYEQENRESKDTEAAYEEMRTTLHEMQSGVPETLAYERFGTRCRLPSYLKLGTLLSQNLRRGTKDLAGLLAEESREAFEDRKALARKLGEECESKLLLPMILMLLTILVMIMYPAVVSFQV